MKEKLTLSGIFIVVIILFLIMVHFLIVAFRDLRGGAVFGTPAGQQHSLRNLYGLRRGYTPSVSDVNSIKPWMTFNYINKIFNLPNEYLKTGLGISDAKYPNITIQKSIQTQGASSTAYLEELKGLVREHLASSTPQ